MPADTFGCNGWIRTSPAMDCLLGRIAISGGQLDDLRSLIQNVEAELQPPPHWKQRQPGVRCGQCSPGNDYGAEIRLTPDCTCLHVVNIDMVKAVEDG